MGMDYKINQGQLVRIKINGTPIMTGVCSTDDRTKTFATGDNDGIVMRRYTVKSMKLALQKVTRYYSLDFYYANIVSTIMPTFLGISSGRVSIPTQTSGLWENSGKSIAQSYDLISKETGLAWWIDPLLELYFCANESSISEAPYNLDQMFGTNFEDYRHVSINGDYSQYANSVEAIGQSYEGTTMEGMQYATEEHNDLINICGYYAFASKVDSNNNYYYEPVEHAIDSGSTYGYIVDNYSDPSHQPDVEIGDFIYNRSKDRDVIDYAFVTTISINSTTTTRFYVTPAMNAADGDYIWYNREFNDVLINQVNSNSAYPPEIVSFDTFTPGFLPRQRIYINLPDVDVEGYFLIEQVQIEDLGNNQFEFTVSGEKKNYSNWITKSDKGSINFFKNF